MNGAEVVERLREIRTHAGDWEAVHSKEDKLLWDVVAAVANGQEIGDAAVVLVAWREEARDQPWW